MHDETTPGRRIHRSQRGREAEYLAVEAQLGLGRAPEVFRLAEAVLLALEGDVLVADAVARQRGDDRLGLRGRDDAILEALQDDHGRADLVRVVDRRALAPER